MVEQDPTSIDASSDVEKYVFDVTEDMLSLSPSAQQAQGRVGRTKPGIYLIDRVVKGEVVDHTINNVTDLNDGKEAQGL
jgi:hypothetical protein